MKQVNDGQDFDKDDLKAQSITLQCVCVSLRIRIKW